MDKIKIGLLGLGNVGRGAYRILTGNKKRNRKQSQEELEIINVNYIMVENERPINQPQPMR